MNSFTILQSEEKTHLAVSVHRNAEIKSIRLTRERAMSDRPDDALKEALELSIDVKSRYIERTKGSLTFEVDLRVAATPKDKIKSKNAFSVECTFEADYELRPGFNPTLEQIKAFKDGNAIFNCWPYCRQHVQDTITRMGFPPPVLPFLRVLTGRRKTRKGSNP
jgi:preprotein translocase subunit SecB